MSRMHCLAPLLTLVSLALGLLTEPAHAQDDPPPEYLVELAILEPAEPRSDAWPIDELASFDVRADPGLVRRFADSVRRIWPWTDWAGLPVAEPFSPRVGMLASDDEDEDLPAGDVTPPEPVERAVQWMALEPPPATLSEAVERLMRDGSFRLVTRQAWLQPTGTSRRPQPARVRDDRVIDLEPIEGPVDEFGITDSDSGDEARTGSAIDAMNPPEAPIQARPRPMDNGSLAIEGRTPSGRFIERPDQPVSDAAILSGSILPSLPPVPKAVTRVDGTVALVQRQFLHAELDLHLREPVQRPGQLEPAHSFEPFEANGANPDVMTEPSDAAGAGPMPMPPETGLEPGWQVHRLTQSRVIRADQWAYFDSDRFGVLIRVTELPPLLPLPEPEPETAPEPASAAGDGLLDAMPGASGRAAAPDSGGF